MKKFLLPCLYGLVTFLILGISLSSCKESGSDWKTELVQSEVYAKFIKSGLEMNNNLARSGMDSKHVQACLKSTGKKYDQAWIDCLASSEQDQRYATLFVRHMANVKALVAVYPEIGTLNREKHKELMVTPITKEMKIYASERITKHSNQ